jgi:hypothetical protein
MITGEDTIVQKRETLEGILLVLNDLFLCNLCTGVIN